MKWNKITTRPLTEEEKEMYPYLFAMMEGEFPELNEQVFVYTKKGGRVIDTWIDYDRGVGFMETYEHHHPVIYWMSFPAPPKDEE
ncbi:hypothetical protein ACEE67_01800 [Streptococcus thoraltensis]